MSRNELMDEHEWRGLGVQQSRGWEHYAIHRPEPHILLFRRPHGTNPVTGIVEPALERQAKLEYYRSMGMDPPAELLQEDPEPEEEGS
eukprot:CAMPEP_0117762312 /NCGR_PEP_ID=MMETSP0947-20121206/17853_1 /TAXON_ID=44440 /ORGANISM="Chattonella subsalsa, Strain CCMP2191" /LENGTH=87 /DNA_ID=CAMNT_0005583575 /DNA_START=131 /DNA_END=394 /DNA_ORIENTATION=-